MEIDYILGPNGELYHSGIKGMRWGVRRYQNPDGSLTPAGRKRYNKQMDKLKAREQKIKAKEKVKARKAKLDAKKTELDEREKALKDGSVSSKVKTKVTESTAKKGVKDMSDEELRSETSRIMAEAQYLNAKRQLAAMNPKQVSKGEKFAKGLMDAAVPKITNALGDVAANYVKKKVSDALGVSDKQVDDEFTRIAKEAKLWENKNKIDEQKKKYGETHSAQKKSQQEAKEAERDRKVEEDVERRMNDIDNKNAKEKAKREAPLEGEVINNRKKSSSNSDSASSKKDPVVIDMDDYMNSNSVTSLVPYGRTYVKNLLEDDDR